MNLFTVSSANRTARKVVNGLVITGLAMVLIIGGVFPALAQDTPYTDTSGQFTATIPDGWVDESTPEYGLFTNSGVSFYLMTVEGSDVQSAISSAVALLAPDLSTTMPTPVGEFPSPSGTWTQVLYSIPGEKVGNAVAQSNGSATVVLLATAADLGVIQVVLTDLNTVIASISIKGRGASTTEATTEAEAPSNANPAINEITFPELTGPYAVGRTRFIWPDDSREEAYTPEEGDPRIVTVWIWYPAAPAADSEIAPYLTDGMSELFQQFYGLGASNIHIHAYESAPVLTSPSGYPVLVFSPGNGQNSLWSSSLMEEIASQGYVVVGLDHAYNSQLTTLANGDVIVGTLEGAAQTEDAFNTRIADVEFVIDQLEGVNSSDELLQGSLDLAHLGIFGHSFGGATAAETCRMDTRCQAVIVFDVPLHGEVSRTGLSQPIMLMDSERISGEQFVEEAEALSGQPVPEGVADVLNDSNVMRDTTAEMLLSSPDAYRVIIDGVRHNNFTDIHLLATAQPALLAYMGGIATIEAERSHEVILDYILAFFDTYLKEEAAPLLESASADYPEVTFSRHQN